MKRLKLLSMIVFAATLIVANTPSQANDAHHPDKAAKAKASVGSKAKPAKKKAPVKGNKEGTSAGNG